MGEDPRPRLAGEHLLDRLARDSAHVLLIVLPAVVSL
jgi:hypothetical protein